MDKLLLKFIADVLYLKGVICVEELEAIYDVKTFHDLDKVFENMMTDKFNIYKRGEGYVRPNSGDSTGVAGWFFDNHFSDEGSTVHPLVYDGAVHVK